MVMGAAGGGVDGHGDDNDDVVACLVFLVGSMSYLLTWENSVSQAEESPIPTATPVIFINCE